MERGGRGGGGHHQLWPAAQNSASFIVESHDSKSPCIPLPRSPPCLFFPRRFFPPAPILFLLSPFLPFSRLPLHRLLRNGLVLRASFHATQAEDAMWIRCSINFVFLSVFVSARHPSLLTSSYFRCRDSAPPVYDPPTRIVSIHVICPKSRPTFARISSQRTSS